MSGLFCPGLPALGYPHPHLSRLDEDTAGRAGDRSAAPRIASALPFPRKCRWKHVPSTHPEDPSLAFALLPTSKSSSETSRPQGGNQDGHTSHSCAQLSSPDFSPELTLLYLTGRLTPSTWTPVTQTATHSKYSTRLFQGFSPPLVSSPDHQRHLLPSPPKLKAWGPSQPSA